MIFQCSLQHQYILPLLRDIAQSYCPSFSGQAQTDHLHLRTDILIPAVGCRNWYSILISANCIFVRLSFRMTVTCSSSSSVNKETKGISSTSAIRISTESDGLIRLRSICEIYPGVTSAFSASSFPVIPFSVRINFIFHQSCTVPFLSFHYTTNADKLSTKTFCPIKYSDLVFFPFSL